MHAAWPFLGQGGFCFLREPPGCLHLFSLASKNGREGRKKMATGARTGGELGSSLGPPRCSAGYRREPGAVYKYWAWCRGRDIRTWATWWQFSLLWSKWQLSPVLTGRRWWRSCRADRPSNDDDDELSAPVVVACKSHSSSIVDLLSDLLDKAQTEFDDTRHAESNAGHNFSMLQQSLEDQFAQLNRALTKAKADVAEFTALLMLRKTDLLEAGKNLSASVASQAASRDRCVQVASEHEARAKGFAEKMIALADATKMLQSQTGGAEEQFRFRDVDTSRRIRSGHSGKACRQGRTLSRSLKEHSIIWRMFMATTLNAATFMGKNFSTPQSVVKNHEKTHLETDVRCHSAVGEQSGRK